MANANRAICSSCGQRAPIVLRGIEARCTVCGALRMPFGSTALNLAGRPSRFGGSAAKFFGYAVLVVGLSMALGTGLIAQSIFGGYVGLGFGLPMGIVTLAIGIALLLGGRQLHRSGDQAARAAQEQTLRALAGHRGGTLTAADAARALNLPEAQADSLLTEMAKRPEEGMGLDVDEQGNIFYLFGTEDQAQRWRVLAAQAPQQPHPAGVRIADPDAEAAALAEQEAIADYDARLRRRQQQ